MEFLMNTNELPKWFNIWWSINIVLAIAFIIYWFTVDFRSDTIVFIFILYGNIWGLWATKYRRKKSAQK